MPYKDIEDRRRWVREEYKRCPERTKRNQLVFRKKRRGWFINYKATHPCEKCDENNPACIEFHNPAGHEVKVSEMVSRHYSIKRIMKEIKRCQCLCANRHRKLHYG